MKIAFTSSTGEMIDQHFGQAENFRIWEVGPEKASFLETVSVGEHGSDEEDRIAARAKLLSDCAIVYTMQIGGPAAAKLVAQKIHPMKTNSEVGLKETVERLQEVLRNNPPPWLRKAMNKGRHRRFWKNKHRGKLHVAHKQGDHQDRPHNNHIWRNKKWLTLPD